MRVLSIFEVDQASQEASGTVATFCSESCRTYAGGIHMKGFQSAVLGESRISDFGYTPHCELCGVEISESGVGCKNRHVPSVPLAVESSITTISCSTPLEQAKTWMTEIETMYHTYYGNNNWNWNDVHDCDRDIFIELEEIIRASEYPPIDHELVCSFNENKWRAAYRNL